jgi:hypothetical protein
LTSRTSPSDATRQPALAWAIAYARAGWPVFPVAPRGKVPLSRHGFKDATTDEATILRWWTDHPAANIGLRTGIAFDVRRLLDWLTNRAIPDPGLTGPTVSTGKGWHYYLRPTGARSGAGLLGPGSGIDFRADGGYVVAPPSTHPSGRTYQWSTARPPTTPLPEPPVWLPDLLPATRPDPPPLHPIILPIDPTRPATDPGNWLGPQDLTTISKLLPPRVAQRLNRPPILDIAASRGLRIYRRGRYYATHCIFHNDSTPSLFFYPDTNSFHCFGCGAWGDSHDLAHDPPTHA